MSSTDHAPARVFLIDAYALIYRSYFAFLRNPLTNQKGENTSAPFGFAHFLFGLRDDEKPDYLAVVFDAGRSHREELFPAYKATRSKMPEELRESLPRIVELVEAFGDAVISVDGFEADDVIGTLAAKASRQGLEAVIVSPDKDFMQLVGDGVRVLNPGRRGRSGTPSQWSDREVVIREWSVEPGQFVDYLALVGDTSDNVPGAPGIGGKTACKLLHQYGSLDELLARAGEVKGKRARESLLANGDQIRLSKELVTIRTDVPVALDLDELRAGTPDRDRLHKLFVELEFRSLMDRICGSGPEDGAEQEPVAALAPARHVLVTDPDSLPSIAQACRDSGVMAVSALTNKPETAWSRLVGIAIAPGPEVAYYLPLAHEGTLGLVEGEGTHGRAGGNLPMLDSPEMNSVIEVLADPGVIKVGHDLKRTLVALSRSGVGLSPPHRDVMVASYVLDSTRRRQNLRALGADFLGVRALTTRQLLGKGKSRRPLADLAPTEAVGFACQQVELPLALWTLFKDRLASADGDGTRSDVSEGADTGPVAVRPGAATTDVHGLEEVFERLETPLIPVLADMELAGVAIDAGFFKRMSERLRQECSVLRTSIVDVAGEDFNVNSPQQLGGILFERLGLPVLKRTKTGASTDSSVLEELAVKVDHPLPRLILEYRQLEKLRGTYVDALPALVNPDTGRIHTTFNQTVASTGRLSSSEPNLQNIPIRTNLGREIRHGFVAGPGRVLLTADYSQIELRVLAHFSGDDVFVRAFREDKDVHRETASVIFDVPVAEVDATMRDRAKTVNFATLYGQGPFSLARQLRISVKEAKGFITEYFERFAQVRSFLDAQVESAKKQGYVSTLMGRRRSVPELRSKVWNMRKFGERIAQNTPIQGTAADLIKVAMIRLGQVLKPLEGVAMLLQVHDELVFEVDRGQVPEVRRTVIEEMEGAMELRVPLKIDVGVGKTWYECKG